MNVNQLHPQPPAQLQRISKEASEKEADFLALRLLNKRSRLRLSPEPLDLDVLPAKARLLAVANSAGWYAAAVRNTDGSYALVLSPLNDLHSVFSSSTSDGPLSLQSRVSLPLPAIPHIVAFTQDDARLLVAFTNGPLSVYDSQAVFQSSAAALPLHTFPFSGRKPVQNIFPSPGDMQTVALVREAGDELPVEILDVYKLASIGGWNAGGSPATNPISASWSPKGKQIAIGLESGDIVTFSPTDTSTVKSVVPKPQNLDGQSIIATTWLSNSEFHAIYAPVGQLSPDVEQSHYVLSLDLKSRTAGDVKLACPYLPFPGVRPPGCFVVTLRAWEPSRLLLFVGDGTSSDIGVLGSLTDSGASTLDSWLNLTLEETSTPTVPLDSDMNDTVLLGLELDLTNDQSYKYTGPSGEDVDVPPPPIMYLYASDGTLTGWYIIQTQGVAYPGMMATRSASAPSISPATSTATDSSAHSAFAAPAPTSAQPSGFGGTNNTSGGFGAFSGAPAKFGGPPFGFGAQTPPAQILQAPPMSAPSVSVEMASATEDTMVSEADGGLGGMSLGGGESSQPRPGAGTLSMFGTSGAPQQQSTPSGSPFGGSGPTSNSTFATFGAGPIKPPTGFGAFGGGSGSSSGFGSGNAFGSGSSGGFGTGSSSAFGGGASAFSSKPAGENDASNPASTESKPSSAFGQTGFGQSTFGQSGFGTNPTATAFGQSSFGQPSASKPAFGQSAFGSTSFGTAATPTKPPPSSAFGGGSSSGGGFAAFATASTSFASAAQQKTPDAKPVWASQAAERKPQDAPSSGGVSSGGKALGAKPTESTTSPSSSAKSTESASSTVASTQPPQSTSGGAFGGLGQGNAFGKSSFGQSSFGQSSFGQPSIGQSAFGQSAFGQSSTPTTTPSKPATTTPFGGGFASFTTAGPSAFSTVPAPKSPPNEAKPVRAVDASEDKPKDAQEQPKPKSAFGTSPSAGSVFGGSSFAVSSASTTSTTPASKPAFGQSAFGSTSFGATATPVKPPPTSAFGSGSSSGGGFAAFTTAPTSFASAAQQKTPDAKPVWASQAAKQKPQDAPSSEGALSAGDVPGAEPTESTSSPSSPSGSAKSTESASSSSGSDNLTDLASSPSGSEKSTKSASSTFASAQPSQSTGAGAFGGLGQSSAFGKSSFGQSSFGRSSFGQSSFGQPSIGKSVFGQSAFGQSSTPATTPLKPATTTPSGGGFASFATARPSAFSTVAAQKSPSNEAKPVWAVAAREDKPKDTQVQPKPKSAFGTSPNAGSVFGGSTFAIPSASTTSTTSVSTTEKTATPVTPAATPPVTPAPKPATVAAASTTPAIPAPVGASAVPIQPPPPSQAAIAQGMQVECLYLFSSLAKELEDLKALATRASARTTQLKKPGNGNKTAQDLLDPAKWILGDLAQFKEIMKEVEREVEKWEKEKPSVVSVMRELESDMLKATTRKEEIARFHKASQDTEFARMLKARTLSPEHLETQAQLRREIRTMRGRIQQLEDHIQASKKKLNSVKNGKPTLKPPSLDTINRTYRNIDVAIEQEEEGVSSLAERVAQLNLASQARGKLSFAASSTRDKRLPDRTGRIGREVTPNIAASTAAALNAERSAQKLKRALLKARKEPLLNTKAIDALPPACEIRSSHKPLLSPESGLGVGAAFAAGMLRMGGFPPATPGMPTPAGPAWTPPPPGSFGMSPAWSPSPPFTAEPTPPSSGRSGAMRPPKERNHGRSAQLSQPAGFVKPPPPPPPVGFSWGPLPKFEPAQKTIPGFSSFSNIKAESTPVKVKEEEKDLGSSWIADSFGALKK